MRVVTSILCQNLGFTFLQVSSFKNELASICLLISIGRNRYKINNMFSLNMSASRDSFMHSCIFRSPLVLPFSIFLIFIIFLSDEVSFLQKAPIFARSLKLNSARWTQVSSLNYMTREALNDRNHGPDNNGHHSHHSSFHHVQANGDPYNVQNNTPFSVQDDERQESENQYNPGTMVSNAAVEIQTALKEILSGICNCNRGKENKGPPRYAVNGGTLYTPDPSSGGKVYSPPRGKNYTGGMNYTLIPGVRIIHSPPKRRKRGTTASDTSGYANSSSNASGLTAQRAHRHLENLQRSHVVTTQNEDFLHPPSSPKTVPGTSSNPPFQKPQIGDFLFMKTDQRLMGRKWHMGMYPILKVGEYFDPHEAETTFSLRLSCASDISSLPYVVQLERHRNCDLKNGRCTCPDVKNYIDMKFTREELADWNGKSNVKILRKAKGVSDGMIVV